MAEHWFDNLSRIMATERSRRQVLRLFVGITVGAAIAVMLPRRAEGAGSGFAIKRLGKRRMKRYKRSMNRHPHIAALRQLMRERGFVADSKLEGYQLIGDGAGSFSETKLAAYELVRKRRPRYTQLKQRYLSSAGESEEVAEVVYSLDELQEDAELVWSTITNEPSSLRQFYSVNEQGKVQRVQREPPQTDYAEVCQEVCTIADGSRTGGADCRTIGQLVGIPLCLTKGVIGGIRCAAHTYFNDENRICDALDGLCASGLCRGNEEMCGDANAAYCAQSGPPNNYSQCCPPGVTWKCCYSVNGTWGGCCPVSTYCCTFDDGGGAGCCVPFVCNLPGYTCHY